MVFTELLRTKKLIFSGHDSFQCRQLWLKRGFDFVNAGNSFNDSDAILKLGVGKNMVSSIRFWMKSFNIINLNDEITEFGLRLLDEENGYDPYLEDEGSLWLLHLQLVKTNFSSIYTLIFNEFRKEKNTFNKDSFLNYIKRYTESNSDINLNLKTISKDFTVFVNLYKSNSNEKGIEDSFSGVLSELDLLSSFGVGKDLFYSIDNSDRDNLPYPIVLFSILENSSYGPSINFNSLMYDFDSPGSIFALSPKGLLNKILDMADNYEEITYTDHAGIKEMQIKKVIKAYNVLDKYYAK